MTEAQNQNKMQVHLTDSLENNVTLLNEILGVNKSFDVICRRLHYAGHPFALYFVDGFAKDDILNYIMEDLAQLRPGELGKHPIKKLVENKIAYLEVESTDEVEKIVTSVLAGQLALLVDGQSEAVLIDARTYPARGPEEPDIERVVRGARDGFVETLIFNTALTRRRLRDPSLRMEHMQVGKRSQTDVVLAYIEDIADPSLVNQLRDKIKKVTVDGLPMGEKSLEEFLFRHHWNPYPIVRFTERPDVAAVHLLEGHVLIYVDTSPSVMITPTTFFHHVQHAEEYRQKPSVGAFLRWVRFFAMFTSLFVLPLWYLFAIEPHLLPDGLQFLGLKKSGEVPLLVQIIMAEIGIEVLRMASIHTPSPLATALGLVAAILLGQIAVDVGLLSAEVILYVAVAVIGTFATPSYEMGLANKLARLMLIIMIGLFKLPGLIIGLLIWLFLLMRINVMGTPYLWPLFPLNVKALWDVLIRTPMPMKTKRPSVISPQDPDRRSG